jgi:hypothetical protein
LPGSRRRWTAKDLQARGLRVVEGGVKEGVVPLRGGRRGKFNAVRTYYCSPLNGPRVYDSKGEAAYAELLDRLWAAGEVRWWVPQLELFCALDPATKKPIRHRVDFLVVFKDGRVEGHEHKGVDLSLGKLKRATAAERYKLPIVIVNKNKDPALS